MELLRGFIDDGSYIHIGIELTNAIRHRRTVTAVTKERKRCREDGGHYEHSGEMAQGLIQSVWLTININRVRRCRKNGSHYEHTGAIDTQGPTIRLADHKYKQSEAMQIGRRSL